MVDWGSLDYAKHLGSTQGQPLYQRLAGLIRDLIAHGQLVEGDLLPPERDFAKMTGLSRGTVSQAYDELKGAGIVAAAPGRGSVVASDRYVGTDSRKEQAIRILSTALDKLEGLGFSTWEIEAFLHLLLRGRETRIKAVLIDCNAEALRLVKSQLESVAHLDLEVMLLDEFPRLDASAFSGVDLFVTTERHAPQVLGVMARHRLPLERFVSVAVAPTRETLIALARLPEESRVVLHTESRTFAEIIAGHLRALGHTRVALEGETPEDPEAWHVVPADCTISKPRTLGFDYRVDRGSILRVEEAVTALLLKGGEGLSFGR